MTIRDELVKIRSAESKIRYARTILEGPESTSATAVRTAMDLLVDAVRMLEKTEREIRTKALPVPSPVSTKYSR